MASDPPPPPRHARVPLPTASAVSLSDDSDQFMQVPVYIVTDAAQLPVDFLEPSAHRPLVIGFDCEGVDLCRHGALCVMQIAYSLIEEQEGRKRSPNDYISFVGLLADPRYCGVPYLEKEEVRVRLRQDPAIWKYRPLSEMLIRAATDDIRFLLYIYQKMVEKLTRRSLWHLGVRGSLYCRCFCINDNDQADWPPLPPLPDDLVAEGYTPKEEILSVLNVPPGKMGQVIGKRGASIMSVKQSCNAEILIGGAKGPPDKVFVIGPVMEVRKAEAIIRGRMLDL
ncbi:uncharacterized protein [Typha angustifolia]|uniref:uncharacterized protein isoform X3 n=1 Tax=Typha angustifolia TaxID=59011 RepID=UPI003C2D4C61